MRELQDHVALVTGASKNIGRAIALAFADSGAKVVLTAVSNLEAVNNVAQEIKEAGGEAFAAPCDVTQQTNVEGLRDQIARQFGRLDVLVNNAAVRHEIPFEDMTFAEWRRILAVTLDGSFLTTHAMLPLLKLSGRASIVNIGGMSAYAGAKNRAHVLAAKSGLGGLTRGLAHDLAPLGITANLVSPGLIETKRDEYAAEPDHHKYRHSLIGRRGQPQEVAAMVCWLAGPSARYVTGQTIHVNGGAFLNN